MLWDYRLEKKWSAVGFCSGAIAGLVAITPGSGYVGARELWQSSLALPSLTLLQLLPFYSASWLAPCATSLHNSNSCSATTIPWISSPVTLSVAWSEIF